jgi:hypothetical protein
LQRNQAPAQRFPNAADIGTSGSTNLSIISSDLKTTKDRDAFTKQGLSTDHNAQQRKLVEGWQYSSFSAKQGKTEYLS